MKKKIALALISLLIFSVMLTWPLYIKPVAASEYTGRSWLYYTMGGMQNSSSDMRGQGGEIGLWSYSTPLQPSWNITFSDPRQLAGYGWIIDLTVPASTWPPGGESYEWNDIIGWVKHATTMTVDGYGWLFLNGTGDVDCYTSNNITGSYWVSPSPMAGTKAADPGTHPSPGPDGVAGTADDGFGDGVADPPGSSILFLKTTTTAYFEPGGQGTGWSPLFSYDWIGVWTTGVAYDIVTEVTSALNGVRTTMEGDPWEFLAGLDHPGQGPVSENHPKWNAYAIYAASWSQMNVSTAMGYLDLLVAETDKKVRWDCAIADIDCNELVDIVDIVMCALAFGAKNLKYPDKKQADPNWDPRGDVADTRGEVDIVDIVRIAINFGWKLTPGCIIK